MMAMAKLIKIFRSAHNFNFPSSSPNKFSPLSQSQFASLYYRIFSSGSSSDKIVDPEDLTPPIPPYTERTGESLELKRARLLYQSRKRGMLENGLLLSTFAAKYLNTFTEDQISSYDKLINKPTNDWEIYYWATGVKEIPEEYVSDVMDLLKEHVRNDEKDVRIRQPDL